MEGRLRFCVLSRRLRRFRRHPARQAGRGNGRQRGRRCPVADRAVLLRALVRAGGARVIRAAFAAVRRTAERAFPPFEWADNAQAEYTLCSVGGEEALIVAHIRYLYGFVFWEGELYIDLTGGAQLPEELRTFEELESGGTVAGYPYAYAARYVGGEYVSDARLSLPAADYYMTVTGRSEDAVFALLRQLAENS